MSISINTSRDSLAPSAASSGASRSPASASNPATRPASAPTVARGFEQSTINRYRDERHPDRLADEQTLFKNAQQASWKARNASMLALFGRLSDESESNA